MGGSGGGGTKSTGTLPWWVKNAHKTLIGNAEDFAYGDRGAYTPYSGQRIAGFTGEENAANQARVDQFNRGDVAGQFAADQYGMASDTAGRLEGVANQRFTSAERDARMNPYLEGVLAPQLREANQSFDRRLNQGQAASIARGGSIGSYRVGLEDTLMEGQRAQQLADITGKGNFDAYNQALQSFESDRSAQLGALNSSMQGYSNIGQGANQLGNDSYARETGMINELDRAGAIQRGMQQQELDLGYNDFTTEQMWPAQQMSWLAGILSGVPNAQLGGIQTQGGQPGIGAQIAGFGLGAAGLAQQFQS